MLTLSKTMVSEQKVRGRPESRFARVLVVDDDVLMIDLARAMLEKLNFRVDTARNGREAMHCLQWTAYDLVLTDLQMPLMNGFELAEWIKENLTETAVIVMTGCSDVDDYVKKNSNLVDRWIFKPFDYAKLRAILSDFFRLESGREMEERN